MTREKLNGRASGAQEFDGVLRRPDGSIDIAAYTRIARRERAVAITSSMREGIRRVRDMVSVIRASLAPAARSESAPGKHHAAARR